MTDERKGDHSRGQEHDLFGAGDDDMVAEDPPIRAVPRRGQPEPQRSPAPGEDSLSEQGVLQALSQPDAEARPLRKSDETPSPTRERKRPAKTGALPALRREMQPDTPALRAERVEAIRRDLVRRRRRKGSNLLLRLAAFVLLPTILVAWFLWERASPLYESNSVFRVLSAESSSGPSNGILSGMFGGGSSQDSVAVQKFILSRDVLRRLDAEHGFIDHYRNDELDYFHRLAADAPFETAFKFYEKMTNVSFDPTEGVLHMSIKASTPEDAQRFAQAILSYSEEMVDQMSVRLREDTLRGALERRSQAEDRVRQARAVEAELRNKEQIFSVPLEVERILGKITQLEVERDGKLRSLKNLLQFAPDSDSRVIRLRSEVSFLEEQINEQKAQITSEDADAITLAEQNQALEAAQAEKEIAQTILAASIEAVQIAETAANRQHRYLAMVDSPSLPDKSAYPRKMQTTALFFLIFLGGYILLTLTISLIREQASI